MGGISAPGVSPSGKGRIYFDTAAGKFKVSENGGASATSSGNGGGNSLDAAFGTNTNQGNGTIRQRIAIDKKRPDGRGTTEIRDITIDRTRRVQNLGIRPSRPSRDHVVDLGLPFHPRQPGLRRLQIRRGGPDPHARRGLGGSRPAG